MLGGQHTALALMEFDVCREDQQWKGKTLYVSQFSDGRGRPRPDPSHRAVSESVHSPVPSPMSLFLR